ncbi:MAG: C-GCAxxG-C-C family protein, partial [Proteobacteria bacterium]|nr:C-GCAxxG-C-C family protein [Pseudomonadota bacterium]
ARHIHGAMGWLWEETFQRPLPEAPSRSGICPKPFHCARQVLARVREKTGKGYPLLERLALVYDGGAGYSGGACGALVGAVLAVNLVVGLDIRQVPYLKTFAPFLRGHKNLLTDASGPPPESFAAGKAILSAFRDRAGATECVAITGRRFSGWDDFQEHAASSSSCRDLTDLAADLACGILGQWAEAPGRAG